LKYIAMSLREVRSANHNLISGAIYHDGKMTGAKPIEVTPIVERIGGGDAFMAGLICGILDGHSIQHIANFATAASALKMTIAGDFNLFTKKEIEAFMSSTSSGSVQR
jgi:2-dehydro-3-deoxygluconokinase